MSIKILLLCRSTFKSTKFMKLLLISDPFKLFLDKSVMAGYMLVPVQQHRRSVIPCLPSSTKINVTLWKTDNEDENGMVSLGSDVTFDPKHGFVLYYPTFYFSGGFQCRAYLGDVYEEINVTLMFLRMSYSSHFSLIIGL